MGIEEYSLEEGLQVQEEESGGKDVFPDVVKGRAKAAQIQAQIRQFVARGQKVGKIWQFLLQNVSDEKLLSIFFDMYQNGVPVDILLQIVCPFIGHIEKDKSCGVVVNKISDYIYWVKKEIGRPEILNEALFKEAIVRIVVVWNVGESLNGDISENQLRQAIFNELVK